MAVTGPKTYPILDLQHTLAAKLAALVGRNAPCDLKDLVWLLRCPEYGPELRRVSGTVPLRQRQVFIEALLETGMAYSWIKRFKYSLGLVGAAHRGSTSGAGENQDAGTSKVT